MGGALCLTQKSEDLLPPLPILHRGPLLVEDSRWGVCWRVGFPCGRFPPLWCFPPRCLGAAPLWFLCRALLLAFMSCVSVFSGVPAPGRAANLFCGVLRCFEKQFCGVLRVFCGVLRVFFKKQCFAVFCSVLGMFCNVLDVFCECFL